MYSYLLEFVTSFSAPCKDVYHDCSIYKPYCEDNRYKEFVSKSCKRTCNLCPQGNFLILLSYNNWKDLVTSLLMIACLIITDIFFICLFIYLFIYLFIILFYFSCLFFIGGGGGEGKGTNCVLPKVDFESDLLIKTFVV